MLSAHLETVSTTVCTKYYLSTWLLVLSRVRCFLKMVTNFNPSEAKNNAFASDLLKFGPFSENNVLYFSNCSSYPLGHFEQIL